MTYEQEEADRRRLWNDILFQVYGTLDLSTLKTTLPPDPEGHALFRAIDMAFTPCGKMTGCIPVHHQLVQYLAGWARDITKGYEQHGGPFDNPRHNHFALRAFRGFIHSLEWAVRHNALTCYEEGRWLYGSFVVPAWFIDKCMDRIYEEAVHQNKMWDEHPSFREYLQNPDFLLEY